MVWWHILENESIIFTNHDNYKRKNENILLIFVDGILIFGSRNKRYSYTVDTLNIWDFLR